VRFARAFLGALASGMAQESDTILFLK